MNTVIGIVVLVVCAIGAVSVVRWILEQAPNLFSRKPANSSPKSFTAQYIEDVLSSVRDRIRNPVPTIVLWSLVGFLCLFKTAEQSFAIVTLIFCFWYLPALFFWGPASRKSAREHEELRAKIRIKSVNAAKKAEEAMKALRDKWAKLEPEERRHQEMLHKIEVTAMRNKIETDMAIDSAITSLEQQIRSRPRGPYPHW